MRGESKWGLSQSHLCDTSLRSSKQQNWAYYIIINKYKQSFYQTKNDYDMKEHVKFTMWLNSHTENKVDT